MKIKYSFLSIATFILLGSLSYAQVLVVDFDFGGSTIFEKKLDDIKGSPFLVEEWSSGQVFSKEGEVYQSDFLKFDCESDIFIIKMDDKMIELNKFLYNKILLNVKDSDGNKTEHQFINGLNEQDHGYYKVIYLSEHVSVLEKTMAKYYEKTVTSYGKDETQKKYNKSTKHFVLFDGDLKQVKKNTKGILKAMGNPSSLERIIKKRKYNLKNDADILLALNEYENQLNANN